MSHCPSTFTDQHYTPDPLVKELYIKQFGQEEYEKNIRDQFRDKSCTLPMSTFIPVLHHVWERAKLYWSLMQLMVGMALLTWQHRGKAVHGDPATVALGKFQLCNKARRHLGLDKKLTLKPMDIRLRHNFGNVRGGHPMAKMVKSASVAIQDWFHLSCLSSNVSGFWNLSSFNYFIQAQIARTEQDVNQSLQILKSLPAMWEIYKALPYQCESYLDLVYHSLIVFDFTHPKRHTKHLVRFRIRPRGAEEAARLMPKEEVSRVYMSDWYSHDDFRKERDVFEKDFVRRLSQSAEGKLWYDIEYQMRDLPVSTKLDKDNENNKKDLWFARHCSIPWPEQDYPFHLLGSFYVDRVEPDKYHAISLTSLFPGLSFAEPDSAHDTASIAWARTHIYKCTQTMRRGCCMP